jgi:dTMP kinase
MSSGLDYWEAGMDQNPGCDPYESFRRFQSKLIREFNRLSREFGFIGLDARGSVESIQVKLRDHVATFLNIEMTSDDRIVTR